MTSVKVVPSSEIDILVATFSVYTQYLSVQRLMAIDIQEDMIDCIEFYDTARPCTEICEGIRGDNRYPILKELDSQQCRPYITELIDRFNL